METPKSVSLLRLCEIFEAMTVGSNRLRITVPLGPPPRLPIPRMFVLPPRGRVRLQPRPEAITR